MNKRILCAVMAALLMLTLAGCGGTTPAAVSETGAPDRTVPVASAGTVSDHSTDSTGEAPAGEHSETDAPETEATTEAPVGTETAAPTETPVGTETAAPTETPVGTETESPTEAPVGTETESPTGTEPQTDAPEETKPEETGDQQSDDFADEDALRDYLIGAWNFYPTNEDDRNTPEIGGIPGLTIQLAPEGMFMAIEHMTYKMYSGTWKLDRLYADADELPDWLRFTLDEPGDDLWGFGDYLIQNWARCTGSDRLSLVQVNNGDSVFYNRFDRFDAMLVKGGDFPTEESADPRTDAHFCAMVWQVADDGNTLWVTEVDPLDFSRGIGSRDAVRYVLAEDCDVRCSTSAFVPGGLVAELETDSAGEIVMINWAEPVLEG